jgi:hypothetical protein
LFLGNTQQISDIGRRRRDAKQKKREKNVILYMNERKNKKDLLNIAKYDLKIMFYMSTQLRFPLRFPL